MLQCTTPDDAHDACVTRWNTKHIIITDSAHAEPLARMGTCFPIARQRRIQPMAPAGSPSQLDQWNLPSESHKPNIPDFHCAGLTADAADLSHDKLMWHFPKRGPCTMGMREGGAVVQSQRLQKT